MQIISAGKVALTSGAALQVSALAGIAAGEAADGSHFAHKLVVRASDTQTGTVYVGGPTVTNTGANAYGAVIKTAGTGQCDYLEIKGNGENDVDLTSLYVISAAATDTVFIYAVVV